MGERIVGGLGGMGGDKELRIEEVRGWREVEGREEGGLEGMR